LAGRRAQRTVAGWGTWGWGWVDGRYQYCQKLQSTTAVKWALSTEYHQTQLCLLNHTVSNTFPNKHKTKLPASSSALSTSTSTAVAINNIALIPVFQQSAYLQPSLATSAVDDFGDLDDR
jgi:hypothetical protein